MIMFMAIAGWVITYNGRADGLGLCVGGNYLNVNILNNPLLTPIYMYTLISLKLQ